MQKFFILLVALAGLSAAAATPGAEGPNHMKKRATYIDGFNDEGPAPAPEVEGAAEGPKHMRKRATYIDGFNDEGPAPAPEVEGEMKE